MNKIDYRQSFGGFVFCLSFVCCFVPSLFSDSSEETDGWGGRCINGRAASGAVLESYGQYRANTSASTSASASDTLLNSSFVHQYLRI